METVVELTDLMGGKEDGIGLPWKEEFLLSKKEIFEVREEVRVAVAMASMKELL